MRKPRLIGKPGSAYHVISRFVDRQFALGSNVQKRAFHEMMIRQAKFAGVEILTFSLMGNHFHILIRIPERPELPEEEVFQRLRHIWSQKRIAELRKRFAHIRDISVEGDTLVERELNRIRHRMHNLSEFMKDLKQRYSRWYNSLNERKGTLFEERFTSVLVQSGRALRMMAAYIDLNAVRAGLVDDPAEFPWCGYAQAVGGNQDRRSGLSAVMSDPRLLNEDPTAAADWRTVARRYRLWLFERGSATQHRDGRPKKRGFSREDTIAAYNAGGNIPPALLLRCKVRHLTQCLVYGSQAFVDELIESHGHRLGIHAKPHLIDFENCTLDHPELDQVEELCGLVNLRGPVLG